MITVFRIMLLLTLSFCLFGAQPSLPDFVHKSQAWQGKPIGVGSLSVRYWEETDASGQHLTRYEIHRDAQKLAGATEPFVLKLRHGDFDPLDRVNPVEPFFEARDDGRVFIVQFVTPVMEPYLETIRLTGATVNWYLAHHAFLITMDRDAREAVARLPFVRWIGPFHPAYRLESALLDVSQTHTRYPSQKYNIMVYRSGMHQKSELAKKITLLGGVVDRIDAGKYLLEATLTPDQLYQVMHFDEVFVIDRWSPFETDMDNARIQGGADYIENTPPFMGFTGQGVRGEVFDAGFNVDHLDFASRPLIEHTTPGVDPHGSSTSGICFGDGTGDPTARGLLPDGQGIVANYNGIMGTANRYTHTGELVQAPYFAVFQTSSVGDDRTTEYTTISADMDAGLFDFDIAHCQSQSNAGDRMSRPQAWAKNIISGGAANHYDTADPGDDCWCGGASIGPATDGRIKPDLYAYYDDIRTTTSGGPSAYTSSFSGTSGATPIICGHIGLVFQMWSEGIFGNAVTPAATVFENRCHMTTAKALAINTANQFPFSGASHDMTRVHQGWGFPSLENLYDMRTKMLVIDETDLLLPMGTNSYDVHVAADEPELKVTLVYADPAGNVSSSVDRINDLSLKVTSPSGTLYWGNNGLLENNYSSPDGTANDVDTVENVFVQNPEAGTWTVEVIASDLVVDSHMETVDLDADYALVATGLEPVPAFSMFVSPRDVVACSDAPIVHDVHLEVTQGFAEPVTLSATGVPGDSVVTFGQNPIVPPGSTTLTVAPPHCWGNVNGDDEVNQDDVDQAMASWAEVLNAGDINLNGAVDVTDLIWIGDNFGTCPAPATGGDFTVIVTGTASSMEKSSFYRMTLFTEMPTQPTLTAPADQATEVATLPSFDWTDADHALDYDFQLASDGAFNNIVHQETLSGSELVLPIRLQSLSTYYWRVRANNGCGSSTFSDVFSFTTMDQPDYMTELFDSDNDLANRFVHFTPNGVGDFYDACGGAAATLPTDPAGGTPITLSDDSFEEVTLTNPVYLYGQSHGTMFVGSNGYVTFGSGDTDTSESLTDHFEQPRVSALFDDLNPASGGTVSYQELADRVVVTFEGVPQYNTAGDSNTFQYEFFFNGDIHLTWLEIGAQDGLAGLSQGQGEPGDFVENDLSSFPACP